MARLNPTQAVGNLGALPENVDGISELDDVPSWVDDLSDAAGLGNVMAVFTRAPSFGGSITYMRKTALHEIAHTLQIGELDDDCGRRLYKDGEIYSGEEDGIRGRTPEVIPGSDDTWSIMSKGSSQATSNDYYEFSIEEILSIDRNREGCF
jgi:hypothetical protein